MLGLVLAWRSDVIEPLPELQAVVDLTAADLEDEDARAILGSLHCLDPGSSLSVSATVAIDGERLRRLCSEIDPAWTVESELPILDVVGQALAAAAAAGADLLVLDATAAPDARSLASMQRCLRRDPHFGFALPRISGYGRRLVRKLDPDLGDPDVALIPERVIDAAPTFYLVRDRVDPCLLVRSDVVRDFHPLDPAFETLNGALQELVARARETGFRTLVVNRALTTAPATRGPSVAPEAKARDRARLLQRFPSYPQLEQLWSELPVHEYEGLLGRAMSHSGALRQRLLVDLSNLMACHNGTTQVIVGLVRGLAEVATDWQVSLLVQPEVAEYHALARLAPTFACEWPVPQGRFSVTLSPTQPWSLEDVARVHRHGLFNFFLMHDTILDDISRETPPGLERVWAFAARWADGLLYNSDYTMRRMQARFPVARGVGEHVIHLATDPVEYRNLEDRGATDPYVFVVGNHYPHKWMTQTVRDLVDAFPFVKLKTLGYQDAAFPRVEGLASGDVAEDVVDRLYAQCQALVFPSRYEGFGFPVVRGLAYGRTVIARDSTLLREIAGLYRGPGRLLAYSTPLELVETLGRVLHGQHVEPLALGTDLGRADAPLRWSDVAARFLSIASERLRKPETSQWQARQELMGAMNLYAGRG